MDFKKPSKKELKEKLSPLQYKVTQRDRTEKPFKNEFWDLKADGIYVDIVSGEPLFSSKDKYDSGTGWPSFTRTIKDNVHTEKADYRIPWRWRTELPRLLSIPSQCDSAGTKKLFPRQRSNGRLQTFELERNVRQTRWSQ